MMDCQLSCSLPLPWIWVLETLAHSDHIDASLLLDLVEKTPEASDDLFRNARELVSLRILETISVDANSTTPASIPRIRLDPSERCEDVLCRILPEKHTTHQKGSEAEMLQWDIKTFIAHKRSSLATKCSLQKLKESVLAGCHFPLASLKEKSGLPVGNSAEHSILPDDDNCNCVELIPEESDTNTQICAANLVYLSQRTSSNENISAIKRKRINPIENTETESIDIDRQNTDVGQGCSIEKEHIECLGRKGLLLDEVLPCENQALQSVAKLPTDKSDGEQEQRCGIEEGNRNKESFRKLRKGVEDTSRFESNVQTNAPGDENEDANIISENDFTDTATKMRNSFGSQCTHKMDFSATDSRGNEEMCHLRKRTRVGNMEQKRTDGDDNDVYGSCKRPFDDDDILPREKEVPHHDTEVTYRIDECNEDVCHEHQPSDIDTNKLDENIRSVHNVSAADEDVCSSSDSDWFFSERKDIAVTKNAFLSSQCTFSQDSLANDWRELNRCMRCNMGENLLFCSSKSCPLVIHVNCLGCDASFNTNGKFYCPWCAYSRALSKYAEAKKRASIARTNLWTFNNVGKPKEPMEQFPESARVKRCLVQNDCLPRGDELNQQRLGEKDGNDSDHRKKPEYELSRTPLPASGDNPVTREENIDLTKRTPSILNNKEKKWGKRKVRRSQSPKAHEHHQLAASGNRNNHYKGTSNQGCEKLKEHGKTRSQKGTLAQKDSDLQGKSGDTKEISELIGNSGASKYFIRAPKQEKKYTYPELPQLRRTKLPWTTAEENMLKDAIQKLCGPHNKVYPWKQILEVGVGIFHESRTTVDLKDKWRNMCKVSPKKK